MRETWSTTLRCRRPCVPPAQVAVGIECDIRNESNICSSSRDLTRCPSTSTVCVCRSFTGEAGRQIWPLFRCTSERIMAPTPKTGLAAGLNKGHVVTKRDKKVKPSHSKGKLGKRTRLIREVVRDVAGLAPYERRVSELLKVGKDKRALKLCKKKLGTHLRAKKKREEMGNLLRKAKK